MPSIIDSLIVELGLDAKNFDKGQKAAIKSIKDLEESASKSGKGIDKSFKNVAQTFSTVQSRLLGIAGLMLGGAGIGAFVSKMVQADASAGRLAYTLGTDVRLLNKWQGAATLVGGSAEATGSFIRGLTEDFQRFALTGDSSFLPVFRSIGVSTVDASGKMRPFNDLLHDFADQVAKISKTDPAKAAQLIKMIGGSDGDIQLLIRGGAALDKLLATSEKLNTLSPEQAANAAKVTQAYNEMALAVEGLYHKVADLLAPELQSFFGWITKVVSGEGFVKKGSIADRIFSTLNGKADENTWKFPKKEAEKSTVSASSGSGAFSSDAEKEAFIRSEAIKRNMDPDQAVRVAKSEGFRDYVGDRGSSFGAYQLHYGNVASGGMKVSGLGDEFTKKTGLDARNKDTEREQIKFALDQAKKGGWGPWHGWKGDPQAGINMPSGGAGLIASQGSRGGGNTSEVKIGTLNVNTQATDAQGMAKDVGPAIKGASWATGANFGAN